jgi:alpha-L-rhamnosidase
MTWANGFYDSPQGHIESGWRLEGDSLDYTATVPPNTRATLYLPARSPTDVEESGMPAARSAGVNFQRYENGDAVFELGSGTYRFTTHIPEPAARERR